MQSLNSDDYRLTFRSPRGCMEPNCSLLVGIATNAGDPGFLDFYISGEIRSWAAVGFSPSRSMVGMREGGRERRGERKEGERGRDGEREGGKGERRRRERSVNEGGRERGGGRRGV